MISPQILSLASYNYCNIYDLIWCLQQRLETDVGNLPPKFITAYVLVSFRQQQLHNLKITFSKAGYTFFPILLRTAYSRTFTSASVMFLGRVGMLFTFCAKIADLWKFYSQSLLSFYDIYEFI